MLSIQEVSKHFGGITAIKDVSFSMEKGEIVGLVGPNGAGKSTLLNIISGIYLPSSGSIIFDGLDITDMNPNKVCKHGIAKTFQLVQSFVAFGQGGLFGTGLGSGKSKLFFLPESHTDFILAVVGEELGFIGVAITLSLFAVILVQGMKAASKAPDPFGTLLAAGLTIMIGLQALINCMVALGLLPTKGMPLPFVSYGGSSLIASMAAAGIVLNVSWAGRAE